MHGVLLFESERSQRAEDLQKKRRQQRSDKNHFVAAAIL
jgi:hypothetical protein